MWYDNQKILSHNCLYNFVLSNRGGGKTYRFKKWAINDFIKNDKEFIYLRRYKTEFKDFDKFFDDIIKNNEYPDHEFKVDGLKCYIDGKLAGYGVALSTALTKKSTSYPNVNKIGFDEFVIDSKVIHYLHNEVVAFLEFFETVTRMRHGVDIKDDVRAFFMANTVSVVNPYFLFWNLKPDMNRRFTKRGQIIVEIFKDEEFVKKKKETRFGQLIDGTDYGAYSIDNAFLKDNDTFVEKRHPNAKFQFSILYNNYEYGFWLDHLNGLIHVSKDVDPYSKAKYVITGSDHKPNFILIRSAKKNGAVAMTLQAYEHGLIRFSDLTVKNQTLEIFQSLRM